MKTAMIQTRVDEELKKSAEEVLSSIGMDMTSAIRLFLTQVVNYKCIPFNLRTEQSAASFIAAEPAATYATAAPSAGQIVNMISTLHKYGWISSDLIQEQAIRSFQEIRKQAESGTRPEMTLEEINEEISKARRERKNKHLL